MANLIITAFQVVNIDQENFSKNDNTDAFIVPFKPTNVALRTTDKIYLRVTCSVLNAASQPIQGIFRMTIANLGEYDFFQYGDQGVAKYVKQVSHNDSLFLPFRLRNLKAINTISNAQLTLTARDSITGSKISTIRFQIEPA